MVTVVATARPSRAEKKAATRERLLKAAERIATREGFARLSLDRVAESAGLTKGAIYSNFESKEDLLLQVADRLTVGLNANEDILASKGFNDLLRRLPETLIEYATKRSKQSTIALEFMAFALRDRTLRNAIRRTDAAVREQNGDVDRWLADHASEFPIPVEDFEQVFDAVATGVLFRRLLYGENSMSDSVIRWVFGRLAGSSD
jgi:AcrR family transcriptional regulator